MSTPSNHTRLTSREKLIVLRTALKKISTNYRALLLTALLVVILIGEWSTDALYLTIQRFLMILTLALFEYYRQFKKKMINEKLSTKASHLLNKSN